MAKMRRIFQDIFDVIIIGGGPSGLSLAASLGSKGLSALVLERAEKNATASKGSDGRTVALSFRSVSLLKRIAAWRFMEKDACPITDIRVADQNADLRLDFKSSEVGEDPFGWIMETHLFHQALRKTVARLQTVTLLHGAKIQAVERRPNQAKVILAEGRVFKAPLIIAADGRNSFLRKEAEIKTYGWAYHQAAVVCLIQHEKPHRHIAVEHFQPGGPFATLPMTKQRSSVVWTEKTETAKELMDMSADDFKQLLQSKVESYLGAISLASQRFSFPLQLQHATHYISERLALVGDAAHGIHPIAGQGFNLGMGDIEVLTELLVDAASLGLDLGSADILRRYEKRRKFENGNMVFMTDSLDRLFSNAIPPLEAARRVGLEIVQNMPPLRRFFMRTAMGVKKAS